MESETVKTSAREAVRSQLVETRRAYASDRAVTDAQAVALPVADQIDSVAGHRTRVFAGYRALPGEIDPAPAIEVLLQRGWALVLPRCGQDGRMEFCPWSHGDELVANSFGVGEPTTAPIPVDVITALIVPGVAFDRRGNRLGHGVGFYDRFFARCAQQSHDPYRLGLAYDFQIVELPDPEPWDIPMDSVVSPSEVIDTSLCE